MFHLLVQVTSTSQLLLSQRAGFAVLNLEGQLIFWLLKEPCGQECTFGRSLSHVLPTEGVFAQSLTENRKKLQALQSRVWNSSPAPRWFQHSVVQLLEKLLPKVNDMRRGLVESSIPVQRAAREEAKEREDEFPLPLPAVHLTPGCFYSSLFLQLMITLRKPRVIHTCENTLLHIWMGGDILYHDIQQADESHICNGSVIGIPHCFYSRFC